MENKELGENIKQKIKDKGVKMNWVAKNIGMSYSCFSHRISGHTPFRYYEIIKISDLLNIDEKDLLL